MVKNNVKLTGLYQCEIVKKILRFEEYNNTCESRVLFPTVFIANTQTTCSGTDCLID